MSNTFVAYDDKGKSTGACIGLAPRSAWRRLGQVRRALPGGGSQHPFARRPSLLLRFPPAEDAFVTFDTFTL